MEMADGTKNACLASSAELKHDIAGLQVRKELKIAQRERNTNGFLACQVLCRSENMTNFTPRQLMDYVWAKYLNTSDEKPTKASDLVRITSFNLQQMRWLIQNLDEHRYWEGAEISKHLGSNNRPSHHGLSDRPGCAEILAVALKLEVPKPSSGSKRSFFSIGK